MRDSGWVIGSVTVAYPQSSDFTQSHEHGVFVLLQLAEVSVRHHVRVRLGGGVVGRPELPAHLEVSPHPILVEFLWRIRAVRPTLAVDHVEKLQAEGHLALSRRRGADRSGARYAL